MSVSLFYLRFCGEFYKDIRKYALDTYMTNRENRALIMAMILSLLETLQMTLMTLESSINGDKH